MPSKWRKLVAGLIKDLLRCCLPRLKAELSDGNREVIEHVDKLCANVPLHNLISALYSNPDMWVPISELLQSLASPYVRKKTGISETLGLFHTH